MRPVYRVCFLVSFFLCSLFGIAHGQTQTPVVSADGNFPADLVLCEFPEKENALGPRTADRIRFYGDVISTDSQKIAW